MTGFKAQGRIKMPEQQAARQRQGQHERLADANHNKGNHDLCPQDIHFTHRLGEKQLPHLSVMLGSRQQCSLQGDEQGQEEDTPIGLHQFGIIEPAAVFRLRQDIPPLLYRNT